MPRPPRWRSSWRPLIEVFSHPEFRTRNNLTGDLLGRAGLDQLHRTEAFQWLNQALAIQEGHYLQSLMRTDHVLEVHT